MSKGKKKRKKTPPPEEKAGIPWLWFVFLGLLALAFYQFLSDPDVCEDGIEVQAKVLGVTSTVSEDSHYGRSIKIYNVELGYTVAGKSTSVIKIFNDGEVYKYFADGVVAGDTVMVLVDEDAPKRYKLVEECG
ncbi:hypothetical protein FUA23_13750 [Neolewinella aurantiaca]|uniref:Uncharacterized protein n=1 Tax=Neolewinella aurantiaca TaxID=2602767 RepID=A0A5C7FDD5_9BACT|nr:hypothetical protein [Neolewinella aurantiaca]TXF88724.1 hypothetical protein FUA23_13750 [Neolewinella aurantiaca]